MATLNTLRTRFGVVLSAVIAFALLAFIFSLKSEMGFSGNDPVVAEINGKSITYSEYLNKYNEVQRQSGVQEMDEQQADMLYNATWQSLLMEYMLEPGIQELGIEISEAERMAIIRGEIPTQALYSLFGNPETGAYDVNALNSFLFTSQGNPEAEAMWATIIEQALSERAMMKYAVLANSGVMANSLEVAEGVDAANKSFNGRWAVKRYSDVDDSEVNVSDEEIKKFYNENKELFKQTPSRTASYVEFSLAPSDQDKKDAEAKAADLAARFAEAKDIRTFIRENRTGSVAPNYVSAAALPTGSSEALVAGKQYGPVNNGTTWSAMRVEDSVYASDTLNVSHIVLQYTDEALADSLLVALKKGSADDFAAAAMAHSQYGESAQRGGEIGDMPYAAFTDEFAAALAPMRKGNVAKVATGDMIQLIRVNEAGPRVKQYRVATVEVPIVASQQTRTAAYNKAGLFVVDAKGGADKFAKAAADNSVSVHNAELASSMRTIAALRGSQEVTRWAHRAEVGDLSEIFKTDDSYVVAMLNNIDDAEYAPLSKVETPIKSRLINDKKYDLIASQVKGSTFEAKAESLGGESNEFSGTNFNTYYLSGAGVEPAVVGVITSSKSGEVSSPIKGYSGVFVSVVDEVVDAEESQTTEAEKLRIEVQAQQQFQQALLPILESISDVKDLRGEKL